MAPSVPVEWELPKLRYSLTFQDDGRYADDVGPDTEFFDVKFYPYSPAGSNPVFAAVSKRHIFVCRLTPSKEGNPCEIIRVIRDDDDDSLNCSCTWTKDPLTERALLCVAGRDAKVKVYDVRDGKAVTSFVGHGGEINDLATSPANPYLVASASDDTTVRLWSLNPVHKEQPCVCLLGGEGHSWNLLSVAFHDTGRYVLSAGHDQVINLWTLPDIPDEHMEVPIVVHFPHFSSSEIHTGLIDCVAFYGDMILSRACYEEVIVLWRIEGFDSSAPPPTPEQAPSNQDATKVTRSAFNAPPAASPSAAAPVQYTRLLQLDTPGCGPQFFMRFGLFNMAGHHPTLAFCNATAKIYFWDFTCFSAYRDYVKACARRDREIRERGPGGGQGLGPVPRPPWLRVTAARKRPTGQANGNGNGHSNNSNSNGNSNGNGSSSATAHLPGSRRLLRDTNGMGLGLRDSADRADAGSDRDSSVFSSIAPGGGGGGAGTPTATSTPDPDGAATMHGMVAKNGVNGGCTIEDLYNAETLEDWASRYSTDDPHARIKAHKVETTKGLSAVGRQVAWSPEGEWCVVVGSNSRLMILHRWAKGEHVDDEEARGLKNGHLKHESN